MHRGSDRGGQRTDGIIACRLQGPSDTGKRGSRARNVEVLGVGPRSESVPWNKWRVGADARVGYARLLVIEIGVENGGDRAIALVNEWR